MPKKIRPISISHTHTQKATYSLLFTNSYLWRADALLVARFVEVRLRHQNQALNADHDLKVDLKIKINVNVNAGVEVGIAAAPEIKGSEY